MKCSDIIGLSFKNLKYKMVITDNLKVLFSKFKDNELQKLDKIDYQVIGNFLNKILIDEKRSFYLKNININDKIYNLYYDPVVHLYFVKTDEIDVIDYVNKVYNAPKTLLRYGRGKFSALMLFCLLGIVGLFSIAADKNIQNKLRTYFPDKQITIFCEKVEAGIGLIKTEGKIIGEDVSGIYHYTKKGLDDFFTNEISLEELTDYFSDGYISDIPLEYIEDRNYYEAIFKGEKRFEVPQDKNELKKESNEKDNSSANITNKDNEKSQEEELVQSLEEDISKQTYSWEIIADTINSNPYLDDYIKNTLLNLKFIFDEDHEYMDLDLIIERLSSLKVECYKEYSFEIEPDLPRAGGVYHISENKIRYFQANTIEDVQFDVLYHELGHVLQNVKDFSQFMEFNHEQWTRELLCRLRDKDMININEIYNYDRNYSVGYDLYHFYYQIIPLFSKEILKEYHYVSDNQILTNFLGLNGEELQLFYQMFEIMPSNTMFEDSTKTLELIDYFQKKFNKGETILAYLNDWYPRVTNELKTYGMFCLHKIGVLDYLYDNQMVDEIDILLNKMYFANCYSESIFSNTYSGQLKIEINFNNEDYGAYTNLINILKECGWSSNNNVFSYKIPVNSEELQKEYNEFLISYEDKYTNNLNNSRN